MLYVLCFDRAYHHARHYVGFTKRADVSVRVEEHMKGRGSPLVRAVIAAGIGVRLVAVREGTRKTERALKDRKDGASICPCCREAYLAKKREREKVRREQRRLTNKEAA